MVCVCFCFPNGYADYEFDRMIKYDCYYYYCCFSRVFCGSDDIFLTEKEEEALFLLQQLQ